MITTDRQAVIAYPKDAHWYNKFYLSCKLGYNCGTHQIPVSGTWIVRPIVNLDGMGKDAVIAYMEQGTVIGPDMFYCEVFTGRHITIDYVRENNQWLQHHTFEGFNTVDNLVEFSKWFRIYDEHPIPDFLQSVESDHINIETIGGNLIEVHLRANPDPVMYSEFWPIWSQHQQPPIGNYKRIIDKDDEVKMGRLGFFVLDNE